MWYQSREVPKYHSLSITTLLTVAIALVAIAIALFVTIAFVTIALTIALAALAITLSVKHGTIWYQPREVPTYFRYSKIYNEKFIKL